ncbi:MAG: uracil-DNA glycosylase family protein [Sulfolobales archaeon]
MSKLEELQKLYEEIKSCRRCNLWINRKNAVPGEGPPNAEIMIIGEAPGATEDQTGRPFVGVAGSLLRKMLKELGLDENKIYITNVVKCRPPNNRTPRKEEIEACSSYLEKQIQLIKPRTIVVLGNVAAQWIHEKAGVRWISMSREHGEVKELVIQGQKIKVIPTYHPSAAVRGSVDPEIIKKDLEKIFSLSIHKKKTTGLTLYDFIKKN